MSGRWEPFLPSTIQRGQQIEVRDVFILETGIDALKSPTCSVPSIVYAARRPADPVYFKPSLLLTVHISGRALNVPCSPPSTRAFGARGQ